MYDFAGPYTIGREHLAFGAPTRYLQLRVSPSDATAWDESVARGCATYEKRMHNLCCDNCHSHVATCLEHFGYNGRTHWDMVTLCFWMFFCGRYVDAAAFLKSWLPFAVLVLVVCVVV
jgi:transmembrane protein 222